MTDLKYLLEDEVDNVVKKGDLSPTELDNVYKAVKTMYYIETITAMRDYSDDGHSKKRHTKDENIKELERMLENASSEIERRAIMECIRNIEK